MTERVCRICGITKDISLFARNKKKVDEIDTICAKCNRKKSSVWRKKNPERVKESKSKWGKTRKRYPEKEKAKHAVSQQVKHAHLPHPTTVKCDHKGCEKNADHYHHYAGYSEENWLTVQPLCIQHHYAAHRKHKE